MIQNIGIIGAGSWGIALAFVLSKNGHNVSVYTRHSDTAAELNNTHENKDKLPGVILPASVRFTSDLSEAVLGKSMIVLVLPSAHIRETAKQIKPIIDEIPAVNKPIIVNCAKGFEDGSLEVMSDVIKDELTDLHVTALSGPSHAEEVGKNLPTTIVVGADTKADAVFVQNTFMNDAFRVYISPDMKGIEIGAALKNVVALASGIADGLGYGDNTKAALITRGIAEIKRLGIAMGGNPDTFNGLSGIGDLIVTCASMHSRNRRAGILIGKGYSMQEAMDEVKMVVEGVYSAKAALALAKKYNVDMPIIMEVNEVLFDGKNPADAVSDLMLRDKKAESSQINW